MHFEREYHSTTGKGACYNSVYEQTRENQVSFFLVYLRSFCFQNFRGLNTRERVPPFLTRGGWVCVCVCVGGGGGGKWGL